MRRGMACDEGASRNGTRSEVEPGLKTAIGGWKAGMLRVTKAVVPAGLTDEQIADIVAYLQALK